MFMLNMIVHKGTTGLKRLKYTEIVMIHRLTGMPTCF